MKKLSFIILVLLAAACQKEPETYCFQCWAAGRTGTDVFCGYTQDEMDQVIAVLRKDEKNFNCTIIDRIGK